jgi:hypothetical protein
MLIMKRPPYPALPSFFVACVLCGLLLYAATPCAGIEPSPAAEAAFNSYIGALESRLQQQHRSQDGFLAHSNSNPQSDARLRNGELTIERLTPEQGAELPGALLHHWRGTAFVAGASPADFERLMKDFSSYPQHFSPQVLQAKTIAQNGDHLQASMRLRQKHILTVVMDMTYDITYGRLDGEHAYSISRSTRIQEIDSPGTAAEHALDTSHEHGYLWHLNVYWSCEERDGGLYMQIETVSLTRSIPSGLGWVVGPFVQSIPRDSMEFTLQSAANALRR